MQSNHETLGDIIKSARQKADITIEDLASRLNNIAKRFMITLHLWFTSISYCTDLCQFYNGMEVQL